MLRTRAMCSVLLLMWASVPVAAEQWSRFRGPNGSGVAPSLSVPAQWDDSNIRWKIELPGVGHSSPVLWDDLMVVACGEESSGRRTLVGLQAGTGKQLWRRDYETATHRKHRLNSFATATPALDEHHVYTCWGTPDEFRVLALDHAGREVWNVDLGPFRAGHGDGMSPIVWQELVIVPKEHEGESALFALDRRTGAVAWRVRREKSRSTWSTPCVLRRGGQSELIFTNWHYGITAVDPDSGRVTWQADVFDKGHIESSIASPIVAGDLVLGVSGWMGVRQEVVAVQAAGGTPSASQRKYTIDRNAPLCTTPLAAGELLFLWSDNGVVTCAELATGKVHWRKRVGGNYYASPISAGDRIYNISAEGELVTLQASREYTVLARHELGEPSHSTPAVAGGVLYLRTVSQLLAVGP